MTRAEITAIVKAAVADAFRSHVAKQHTQLVQIQKTVDTIRANDAARVGVPAPAAAPLSTEQLVSVVRQVAQQPGTSEADRATLTAFVIKAQTANGSSRIDPLQPRRREAVRLLR